jgi:hypothetical protein
MKTVNFSYKNLHFFLFPLFFLFYKITMTTTDKKALRNAASLMIVAPIPKDAITDTSTSNFKVLLLKRNAKSSFVNAHVYPGGVVDTADHYSNWSQSTLSQQE